MITPTLQYPRETVRIEFLGIITNAVLTGRNIQFLKRTGMSERQIARAVSISDRLVKQTLTFHEMFAKTFGPKTLVKEAENVILDPAKLVKFLSEPAATQLASEISGMSEASIHKIVKRT